MRERALPAAACLFLALALASCGIEDIPFLSPVPPVPQTTGTGAIGVALPPAGAAGFAQYFASFVIFYRIYLSTEGVLDTWDERAAISPALAGDYAHFLSWADPTGTTQNTAEVGRVFTNRGFFRLQLEDADITEVLGRASMGATMEVSFHPAPGQSPQLVLGDRSYYLRRAGEEARVHFHNHDPMPVTGTPPRFLPFFNDPQMRDGENLERNADVAGRPGAPEDQVQHSYALMYIAASGLNLDMPRMEVFSQPTFLGIFRLPNPH